MKPGGIKISHWTLKVKVNTIITTNCLYEFGTSLMFRKINLFVKITEVWDDAVTGRWWLIYEYQTDRHCISEDFNLITCQENLEYHSLTRNFLDAKQKMPCTRQPRFGKHKKTKRVLPRPQKSRVKVAWATKFCAVASNINGS